MTDELALSEAQALTAHEAVIERGLTTFTEVGNALLAIRDQRLYRAEHSTFEDYCQQRWGFSERRARQLMTSAEIVGTIVPTGLPAPANEGQARTLALIPAPQRAEVWRETLERTEGKPTARAIWETYAPPPADAAPVAPLWQAEETGNAETVRCAEGHIAARETFKDVGGCPYCLHTQGERQAALHARETLLRRQHDEQEAADLARLDAELNAEMQSTESRFRRNFAAAAVKAGEITGFDPDRITEVFTDNWDRDVRDLLDTLTDWCARVADARKRRQRAGLRVVGGGQ